MESPNLTEVKQKQAYVMIKAMCFCYGCALQWSECRSHRMVDARALRVHCLSAWFNQNVCCHLIILLNLKYIFQIENMSQRVTSIISGFKSSILGRTNQCRPLFTTSKLNAEPPRKKRRIDPAVLKLRVERKIGRTEREIQRLENEPKQLIPILEYQYTNSEIRDLQSRPEHSLEDAGITAADVRAAQRMWSFYRVEQSKILYKSIRRMERAQARALDTLKELDKDLYDRTVSVDETLLIPYRSSLIRKETAPNPNYVPPDGYVKDISKKWVM